MLYGIAHAILRYKKQQHLQKQKILALTMRDSDLWPTGGKGCRTPKLYACKLQIQPAPNEKRGSRNSQNEEVFVTTLRHTKRKLDRPSCIT